MVAISPSILVIIPARNESATIAQVIRDLQSHQLTQIRVVDNGSQDDTAIVAIQQGAEVVFEPISGYGQACSKGLEQLPNTVEWLLFCDADQSDDLSQIPLFLAHKDEFDLILGNRRASYAARQSLTPVQNFGNGLATFLIKLGWGYSYQDLGPLRLIRRQALARLEMEDRGFGWTVEMQVKAVEQGLKIIELPVNYFPRQGGKSKISGTIQGSIQAGTIILTTLAKLYLRRRQDLLLKLAPLLLIGGAALMLPGGDFTNPSSTGWFWWGAVVMSAGFLLSWGLDRIPGASFWVVAVVTRLILLPMTPSDDIWRYLWEGYIQTLGYSPYDLAPDAVQLIPYRPEWWHLINHPQVSAIYPPITQWGFRWLAALNPGVLLFKLSFTVADLVTCGLLWRRYGGQLTSLYGWNPLVIYSFAGAGHYDSWFILPLVGAWLCWGSNYWLSALLLGLSGGVKWVSLPLGAFVLKRNPGLIVIMLFPLLVTAIPFCRGISCPLIPTSSGFVTHGRSAEFVPYLVGLVWDYSLQVNWLYAIPLAIALLILLLRSKTFTEFSLGYFFALYLFSPIIHAWYFTWSIAFGVPGKNLVIKGLSLSAFVYFLLPYRQGLGITNWYLYPIERLWLWLPMLLWLFQFIFSLSWFNQARTVK